MCDPVVDPEFSHLIPPLTKDEKNILEAKIIAEGMREPILTWRNLIVDGHHRWEICAANGIAFECREMKFPDRNAAMLWMIDHQKGRRNITPSQLAMVAAKLADLTRDSKTKDGRAGTPMGVSGAAKEMHVAVNQVDRARIIIRKGDPKLAAAVVAGDVSVRAASDVATLPKTEQRIIVRKGADAVTEAAKAIREHKPVAESALPDVTPFDTALNSLKVVMGVIHHLCGDGRERKATASGTFIMERRQELEAHVDGLRRAFRFCRPFAECPYCAARKSKSCTACLGGGWVTEAAFNAAPKDLKGKK
jgi:hypothetical protein